MKGKDLSKILKKGGVIKKEALNLSRVGHSASYVVLYSFE